MARICINIVRDGQPCIIAEDIEYAAQDAGFVTTDSDGETNIDIAHQDDDCWTVDVYDRRVVSDDQVETFKSHLEKSTRAEIEVEHIADWPTKDWAYASREVRY